MLKPTECYYTGETYNFSGRQSRLYKHTSTIHSNTHVSHDNIKYCFSQIIFVL